MESRFYYSVTRISTIEFCIICHTLQLVRLTRRSVSTAIREASLIGFSVRSLCAYSLCVRFFLPPFNQTIIDGFHSLRCLQIGLDKMIKSIILKFSKFDI